MITDSLTKKALSIQQRQIFLRVFTYKMAAEINGKKWNKITSLPPDLAPGALPPGLSPQQPIRLLPQIQPTCDAPGRSRQASTIIEKMTEQQLINQEKG